MHPKLLSAVVVALVTALLIVPGEAASSAAVPEGAVTTTHHLTAAAFQVHGTPIHVGRPVSFTFTGSTIDLRFRIVRSVLSFGDGTSARISNLSAGKSHRYKRKGVYTVTFRLPDSGGHGAVKHRTIVVAGPNKLRFRAGTGRLAARAVAAVQAVDASHLRITLVKGTALPPVGSALVVAPGRVLPRGAAIVVRVRSADGTGRPVVEGPNARLSDIYSTLRTATTTGVPDQFPLTRRSADGRLTGASLAASTAVPFLCHRTSDNSRPIKVTADLSHTLIEPTIDLGARTFQLIVIARPTFSLGVSFEGAAKCELGDDFALNIPIPAVPGLVVSISPYFELSATGTISADASYSPTLIMEVTRSPSRDANFLQLTANATAAATGTASVSLEGGLSLTLSVAQAAGFQAQLGPKISVEASTSTANGGQFCATATSAIEASVKLFANVIFVSANAILYNGEFYKTVLFEKCTPAGTGGGATAGSGSASDEGSPSGGGGGTPAPPGPASVTATNNNGQLGVQLVNFPLGTAYYFCHAGDAVGYPTGGAVTSHGQITLTRFDAAFESGLCAGSGNTWIGLQAPDGHDYYSNQVNLVYLVPTVTAANNNGQMAVGLANYPLGTTYYFCHAGDPSGFPAGGSITGQGHFTVTSSSASYSSGICSGSGNSWIGFQAPDGNDYYSNQTDLHYSAPTATASNNDGQLAVQLGSFPLGTTYFFCHSGVAGDYPRGGVITGHGQINVTSPDQGWSSGLCSGRGNAWIGFQASDGHDYYGNQVDLYAPPRAGAGVNATGSNGNLSVQFSQFPTGVTYYFCHAGDPSGYPTGGSVPSNGQITITSPDQAFGSLCSGTGNFWVGFQATDGHDYYTNQVVL